MITLAESPFRENSVYIIYNVQEEDLLCETATKLKKMNFPSAILRLLMIQYLHKVVQTKHCMLKLLIENVKYTLQIILL